MPSISQTKLDELEAARDMLRGDLESVREVLHGERIEREALVRSVRQFDAILDKLVRAAQGQPLSSSRDSYGSTFQGSTFHGFSPMVDVDGRPDKARKVGTEERLEREIRMLNGRIVTLESRIAAVTAVATFAKDHKC